MNSKENLQQILNIIIEYNKFFTQINKETYFNMSRSTKLIKDLQENKIQNNYMDIKRILKVQIYSMKLSLESIEDKINIFLNE